MSDADGEPATYEAETDGLIVRVTPQFLDDQSDPVRNRYVWAYTVEIENASARTWTLTNRHWRIVDKQGRTQTVDGEGVVGQQPRLEPGESFEYTSGAPLGAPSGMMGGRYDFVGEDGTSKTASVPTFSLDSPYDRARPS